MAKRSNAWKALEREAAALLRGKRVVRGDYGASDTDVKTEFPHLKIDCKYRQSHAHHALLDGIKKKYCRELQDKPVLVTKHHRQPGCNVTIDGGYFSLLLDCYRVVDRLQLADPYMALDIAREVSADGEELMAGIGWVRSRNQDKGGRND